MKTSTFFTLFYLLVSSLIAGVPSTLNYQGRVLQNGQPFDGTGHFVFGIYEGSTLLWTNKLPVPSPLNDPAVAIDSSDAKALSVRNGVFNVRLGEGDANNAPVGTDVFFKFDGTQRVRTDVKLKVWFSSAAEGPYTKLEPDITFASVPFAQVAGVAETVKEGAVDSSILADGAVTLAKIEPGWGTVPPGTIISYGIPGTGLPDGYLECNGGTVAAANYPRLAALLGEGNASVYGSVGAGMIKLPDLRGRVPMGQGQGSGLTNRIFATSFGAETHTLTVQQLPAHNHPVNDPGHSHGFQAGGGGSNALVPVADNRGGGNLPVPNWGVVGNTTGITVGNRGDGQPFNITQPSLVVRYLIKY